MGGERGGPDRGPGWGGRADVEENARQLDGEVMVHVRWLRTCCRDLLASIPTAASVVEGDTAGLAWSLARASQVASELRTAALEVESRGLAPFAEKDVSTSSEAHAADVAKTKDTDQPPKSDDDRMPITLTDTEQNIIEGLGNKTLTATELAKKIRYPYNSNFRSTLSTLRKRGILGNRSPGYFLEPRYHCLLASDSCQDKCQG